MITETRTTTPTLADVDARIARWTAMPRSEHRTRALRSLKLSARYLRGEKVPAYVVAQFEG